MRRSTLRKLGFIIYHVLTLKSEDISMDDYTRCCDKIYETLLEVAPEVPKRELNPDIKEFVELTNRRLNNEQR